MAAHQSGAISLDKLGYSWDQNDNDVRIYLALPDAESERVQCQCSRRCAALTAEAGSPLQLYFFEIKGLYAPIDPEQSGARVPRHKRHVTLRLRKQQPGLEWPWLRGLDDVVSHI